MTIISPRQTLRVTLTALLAVVFCSSLFSGQNLLSSYRGAAAAYREAANKAPASRRACYLEWAAYHDAVASAIERGA